MIVDAIALANFKAFQEIEVPLGALTLLSGLNGSGKSSVVQALGLLRQSLDEGILRSGEIALNGELVEIGTGRDVRFQGFAASTITIGLVCGSGGEAQLHEWVAEAPNEADVLTCLRRPDEGAYDFNVFRQGFQLLRADRIVPALTFPKSHHAVGTDRFLGARGEFTAHFLLKFGEEKEVDMAQRHPSSTDSPSLLSQVNAWMQEFSPGVRVEPQAVPMTDLVRLAFSYRGSGAAYSEPMRPTNVGFGLTHALPVVTACLAASPGSLVVIENPEAQLHPRGQAAMGRLLAITASRGVQVVVESHSDHVLNGIRIAAKIDGIAADAVRLHFFQRGNSGVAERESPELRPDGRLSFWPRDFFDQWERSLDTLLDDDG